MVFSVTTGAEGLQEPAGYRMDDYRAPTPQTLQGATVLSTDAAHAAWERHQAVFVDVLPQPPRPAGLPASTLWHPRPRADVPGSIWLPDTGYGALAPGMAGYFETSLERATAGDRARMLVFYCLMDCWMSWNAAKRALSLGYLHVAWYPDGTDGWVAHAFPTAVNEPVPRPRMQE
ncbi:MAG: PQQ-dependent catabolism-associated CXXCW motif protein [Acetobacteraceae bacterium]|nr:PQQ-dependent catabolism-associated CXXCW motif protein [Acetobacteraceae bacterium]